MLPVYKMGALLGIGWQGAFLPGINPCLTANDSNPLLCSNLSLHTGITSLKDCCISACPYVAMCCASNTTLKMEEGVYFFPASVPAGLVYFHIGAGNFFYVFIVYYRSDFV